MEICETEESHKIRLLQLLKQKIKLHNTKSFDSWKNFLLICLIYPNQQEFVEVFLIKAYIEVGVNETLPKVLWKVVVYVVAVSKLWLSEIESQLVRRNESKLQNWTFESVLLEVLEDMLLGGWVWKILKDDRSTVADWGEKMLHILGCENVRVPRGILSSHVL